MTDDTDRLRAGRRMMNQSRYLVTVEGPTPEAEKKARDGLRILRSAMNWLEGTDDFETAHSALDEAGRYTRETFGCWLTLDEQGYAVTCPVSLAHNRVGLSIGGIVREARCSVCQLDPYDCDHITGEYYDGILCVREVHRIDLLEVSFVTRPAQPDARIERMSVSARELQQHLGTKWKPGMPVSCDRCLTSCSGLEYPELSH